MESEQSTTQQRTSWNGSERSTTLDRLTYATERAEILFGCYRRGDANDPDRYVASIAAVLTLYEPALIREVSDPRTGISTTEKFASFMPNSGELKVYCDAIRDRRSRYDHLGALPRQLILPRYLDTTTPGRRANVFIAAAAPQYQRALELAKTADPADWKLDEEGRAGIWIGLGLLHGLDRKDGLKPYRTMTDAELRERYPVRQEAAE